nr:response regulator transcription factor [Aquibacillus albus]
MIAQDQGLFRDMMTSIINDMEAFKVIGAVSNGKEVIELIENVQVIPYLCLLDINLEQQEEMACTKWLKKNYPTIKVVLTTAYKEQTCIEEIISARADGYIFRGSGIDQFQQALRFITEGQFVAPTNLVHQFSKRLSKLQKLEEQRSLDYYKKLFHDYDDLSERDLRIIQYMGSGFSNQMIADDLDLNVGTVKNYISIIYKKLNISNRRELKELLPKFIS